MSSSESFYWFDYETSGAEVSVDRPLQFAGVRTDPDFNVIGEPLVIYNRLTPDVLPHPAAVRITAIPPSKTLAEGLSEREFISQIHAQLAQPGTCGLGYNSIRFDDEITRYALYRNFMDPYARERNQGRSRWDLLDVTRAIFALRPQGLEWPLRDDGLPSFRLEELTAANGIDHGAAHDALSDVLATIGLARVLRKAQPALFDALYALRSKESLAPLLDIAAMKPVVHVSGMLGASRSNLALVVPLAMYPGRRNEIICADLSRDPDFLFEDAEVIRQRLFTRQEDLPEGTVRPPLKTIHLGRAPVILPSEWVQGEPAERLRLDGDQHRSALAAIRGARDADPKGFTDFVQSIFAERDFPPRTDPDTQLYGGFFERADSGQFAEISAADPEALAERSWVFRDKRLPELLFRFRARNYPESLSADESARWLEWCAQKHADPDGFNWGLFDQEMAEQEALPGLSDKQINALNDLRDYANQLRASLRLTAS